MSIEDNFWRKKGLRMTAEEQIEQVAKLLEQRVVRAFLNIAVWPNTVDERSQIGLPNRGTVQMGFIVKDTDERLGKPALSSCMPPLT